MQNSNQSNQDLKKKENQDTQNLQNDPKRSGQDQDQQRLGKMHSNKEGGSYEEGEERDDYRDPSKDVNSQADSMQGSMPNKQGIGGQNEMNKDNSGSRQQSQNQQGNMRQDDEGGDKTDFGSNKKNR